ncbi:DUF2249 domain-containing protein [Bosea sp. (in: a-proteobacteria)]|uniref:DUF2249 domain-containing protein n=1 Tax=Bosea sp. (in: a-proteobacteria) TaxID=1871050 RepID=UPI003F70AC78
MNSLPTEPLDVRTIPPTIRHATIFGIIERLDPGATFSIVNDHDPAPLRRQIETRYPGGYSWTYVVEGPHYWQVEIGRAEGEPPADCGGHGEGSPCTCGH